MDTGNQVYLFFVCLLSGYVGGVFYEIFSFLRLVFGCERGKNKIIGVVLDVAFFIGFGIWAVLTAKCFQLPDFRVYMWIAYLGGWILYLKSLHLLLDFLKKVCYNCLKKAVKERKMSKNSTFSEEKTI